MSTPRTTSDTIMSRRGWSDGELKILAGELYEVWLHHDWEEPKACVPVDRVFTVPGAPDWKILVDGQVKEVHGGQIFRTGTATRPDPPFTMPIIRNAPALLFAINDVKVQPMTMPVSSIFYMDYKCGEEEK
jgi:hypothetical protein